MWGEPKFKIGDLIFIVSFNQIYIDRIHMIQLATDDTEDGFKYNGADEERCFKNYTYIPKNKRSPIRDTKRAYRWWFRKAQ
jgi:hypothetical protein